MVKMPIHLFCLHSCASQVGEANLQRSNFEGKGQTRDCEKYSRPKYPAGTQNGEAANNCRGDSSQYNDHYSRNGKPPVTPNNAFKRVHDNPGVTSAVCVELPEQPGNYVSQKQDDSNDIQKF